MLNWLTNNWLKLAIPILAFLAVYVISLWVNRLFDRVLAHWTTRTKWEGSHLVARTLRRALLYWFLFLGILIAIQVSGLPSAAKSITGKTVGSLFFLSLVWIVMALGEQLIRLYLPRLRPHQHVVSLTVNVARTLLVIIGVSVVLEIWGVPTSPVLVVVGIAVVVIALAGRDAVPNLFAGFQISAAQHIKVGDYIKLETGEEGYVLAMNWTNTRIKSIDETTIIVPNNRLVQRTVINYGRPLKTAGEPFEFNSRTILTELTGMKAGSTGELVAILKGVPDAVVYYHTHRFLEQRHHIAPDPSNDFALWAADALGDEVLGEKLGSVDTFAFSNLHALRDRLIAIIEEHLAGGHSSREAVPGREFHFMKSVGFILPTPYVVHDLREFAEALRKVSPACLNFHIFESRLRLGKGLNDFSTWLQVSLGETDLAQEIARLDPYTYTLEGLRSALIHLIEKRIK